MADKDFTPAVGVHEHPDYKLGRAPKIPERAKLEFGNFLRAGAIPEHPLSVDDLTDVQFGLDMNDQYGDCVPTGFDNFRRMVTKLLTGTQVNANQDDIFRWYRTQNPNFDPAKYREQDDQGMVIQYFLEELVKEGVILGFAAVDTKNSAEMQAALYLFLGLVIGVDLEVAQQGQTDHGFWDYSASAEWGGHCVMVGAYTGASDECITWAERVRMTSKFIANQVDEAWAVILPEHVARPDFRAGFDLQKFAWAYESITGSSFPVEIAPVIVPDPPTPAPNPDGPTPAPEPIVTDSLVVPITDDAVAAKMLHAAQRSDQHTVGEWVTHHFKKYFKL